MVSDAELITWAIDAGFSIQSDYGEGKKIPYHRHSNFAEFRRNNTAAGGA